MQTEPQLSAEMEEELQIVIGEALDKIDNQDGSSLISQGNFETAGFILPEVLHFLATALEEQRQSFIFAINTMELSGKSDDYRQAQDHILAILNGETL